MRAVRYDGQHVFLDERAPDPEPRGGEAVVRAQRVTIGPRDLAVCRGLLGFRGVVGREMVGVVERVEGETGRDLIGARVVCDTIDAPPESELARRGLYWHAPDRRELGVRGRDGCLADLVAAPVASLRRVPDAIDNDHAVLCVALGEALRLAETAGVRAGAYVSVVGDDAVALLCAQVLSVRDVAVRVLGRAPSRYLRCERWGIPHRHVSEAGRLADQDAVIVTDPGVDAMTAAVGLVRPCGRVVVGGLAGGSAGAGFDTESLVEREASVVGVRGGSVGEALGALTGAKRPLDLVGLITRRYRFADAINALRGADDEDQIRVVVDL